MELKEVYEAMEGLTPDEEDSIACTDTFRCYFYKVVPCAKPYLHDRLACPFTHTGEKAKRRDPRLHNGTACPAMKRSASCPQGDYCPHSHNIFEFWLHPSRYRTELCHDGSRCARKLCFFAHSPEQLRTPSPACDKLPKIPSPPASSAASSSSGRPAGPQAARRSMEVASSTAWPARNTDRRSLDAGYARYLQEARSGTAGVIMPMLAAGGDASAASARLPPRHSLDSSASLRSSPPLQQQQQQQLQALSAALLQGGGGAPLLPPGAVHDLAERLAMQQAPQPQLNSLLLAMQLQQQAQAQRHQQERDAATLALQQQLHQLQHLSSPGPTPAPAADLLAAVSQMLAQQQVQAQLADLQAQQQGQQQQQQQGQQQQVLPFCRPPGQQAGGQLPGLAGWPMGLQQQQQQQQQHVPTTAPMSGPNSGAGVPGLSPSLLHDWAGLSASAADNGWGEELDQHHQMDHLDSLLASLVMEHDEAVSAGDRHLVPVSSLKAGTKGGPAPASDGQARPGALSGANAASGSVSEAVRSAAAAPYSADAAGSTTSKSNGQGWGAPAASRPHSSRALVSGSSSWQEETCDGEMSTGVWGMTGVRSEMASAAW